MEYIFIAIPLLHQMGVTLGIGASTFALIFYIQAMQDGSVDAVERRVLRTVIAVMRIGMALIIGVLLFTGGYYYLNNIPILRDTLFIVESMLMTIIVANALLMNARLMPMWIGPAIAGGTWYSLFLLHTLPFIQNKTQAMLCVYYVLFVAIFYSVFTIIKSFFSPRYMNDKTQMRETIAMQATTPVAVVEETLVVVTETPTETPVSESTTTPKGNSPST